MPNPLLLYSTNTWLAFAISERYYRGRHWVWCSPYFRPARGVTADAMPPTAIPGEIYDSLDREVAAGDRHSAWISKNKVGLMKGAGVKRKEGVITKKQLDEIASIVKDAEVRDFRPLLYVMPYSRVRRSLRDVPPTEKAHPLSTEYIIESLPGASFDVLELRRRDV